MSNIDSLHGDLTIRNHVVAHALSGLYNFDVWPFDPEGSSFIVYHVNKRISRVAEQKILSHVCLLKGAHMACHVTREKVLESALFNFYNQQDDD